MTFTNQTEVETVTDMAARFAEAMVASYVATNGNVPTQEVIADFASLAVGLADGVIAGAKEVVQQRKSVPHSA